jgi:Protein of unknown function (DUF2924)
MTCSPRQGSGPARNWLRVRQDETHRVTALPEGFEWKGSPSAIAREITGTNWNGYAFLV